MSTFNLHLSEQHQSYLKEEAARRGYKDANELLEQLIIADQHKRKQQEIETLLMETTDDAFSEWTDQDMDDIRATGQRLIQKRRSA